MVQDYTTCIVVKIAIIRTNIKMIHFDESSHTYTNLDGEILISATTLIHLYAQPFDPKGEIVARCADRKGISVKDMQAIWDNERDSANVRGNSFHSQAEYWVKNDRSVDENGDYADVVVQLNKMPFKGRLISEEIVYNNRLKIAGTIDLQEDLGNKVRKIFDFKTNKELKTRGYFDRKSRSYSHMLYPVDHLEDCNWNHYCLQLSGYQILQEEAGYSIIDRELIYVNPKTRKIERYEVPDLRREFMELVDHYSSTII